MVRLTPISAIADTDFAATPVAKRFGHASFSLGVPIDERKSMNRPTRRTLVKAGAWTTPAAVMSVAAPAYAVSQGCLEAQALITPTSTRVTTLGFAPSDVTATVTYTSTTYPAGGLPSDTGRAFDVAASPPWVAIVLVHTQPGADLSMLVSLSRPVADLSLTIGGIGAGLGGDLGLVWSDLVTVDTPSYVVTAREIGIGGSGAPGDPFRSTDGVLRSSVVSVRWPGPVSAVQLTYVAGGDDVRSDAPQYIDVGKFGFSC
jgi:hypothetical protein